MRRVGVSMKQCAAEIRYGSDDMVIGKGGEEEG